MTIRPVTGIIWWKPGQWEIAKQISDDSGTFDDSYEEWKEVAEEAVKSFRAKGMIVYKIEVDLDELATWCREQNRPLDSSARTEYAANKSREMHQSEGDGGGDYRRKPK